MRRLAAIAAVVALAGCGSAPTAPAPGVGTPIIPAPASFEGVWALKYQLADCSGERHCVLLKGSTYDFSLRVVRNGAGYDGVVLLPSGQAHVDVAGSVDAEGGLVLTGTLRAPFPTGYDVEVTRLRLPAASGSVTGELDYTLRGPSTPWIFGTARRAGPLVSATKVANIVPASVRDFTGKWSGRVATRECSSVGWQDCYPLEPREVWNFDLTLTDAGAQVAGIFQSPRRANVEGAVSGTTITLHGTGEDTNNSGLNAVITTIRPSSLTRDLVGRLKGSLSLEIRWLWKDGRVSSSDFRVIELIDVVLMPPS